MNDVMQGRWTLLHVIGLVVWQKHVKSLSLSLIDSWNSKFFEILVDGATLADWLLQIFHFLPMPPLNRIMYHRLGVL